MAFTAGLTGGLTEPITKTLLEDYFYGKLTLEQMVAALGSTLWLDATETYAKSKVAVDLASGRYLSSSSSAYGFNIGDPFTFITVLNYDTVGGVNQFLFSKQDGGAKGYGCRWNGNTKVFFFDIYENASNNIRVNFSYPSAANNKFYAVACVYDGGDTSSSVKVFVCNLTDGETTFTELSGSSFGTGTPSNISNTADLQVNAFGGSYNSDGQLDQFTCFDTNLSESQLNEHINGGDGLQYKDLDSTETFYSNIVAWYDFNRPDAFGQDYHTGGLDLTPVSITSANAVLGHIEGKAAGYDGLTLVTGRSGGVNAIQATITEIGTWYTDNYMRFTGSDNLDTSANIDLSGDFTIVMRCRQSDVTESSDLLSTSHTILNNSVAGKDVTLGVTATTAHTNNTWHTVAVKSESGTISFRLDGTANGSGSRDATVVTSTTMTISDTTLTQNFDVRGLLVKESALSDSNISTVEQYFATLDP
jgi:hypothetical protein